LIWRHSYWDNVGGETLDVAIGAAARGARFIECGMISTYHGAAPYPFKNMMMMVTKQQQINGFIAILEPEDLEAFQREIPPKVARGEIIYVESITHGLENAVEALLDVLTGKSMGKSVVLVAEE